MTGIPNIAHALATACGDVGLEIERRQLDALAARITELLEAERSEPEFRPLRATACPACDDGNWAFLFADGAAGELVEVVEPCQVCRATGASS